MQKRCSCYQCYRHPRYAAEGMKADGSFHRGRSFRFLYQAKRDQAKMEATNQFQFVDLWILNGSCLKDNNA